MKRGVSKSVIILGFDPTFNFNFFIYIYFTVKLIKKMSILNYTK